MVYRPQQPVVVATWSSCHATVQQRLHRLRRKHKGLESKRCCRSVEKLRAIPPDARSPWSAPVVELSRELTVLVDEAAQVAELNRRGVPLPLCFDDRRRW